VSKLAIIFGNLLIILGLVSYFAAEPAARSVTALIPAFVGMLIEAAGVLALNPKMRMHAMHLAATVALLGFLAAAGRFFSKLIKGQLPQGISLMSLTLMMILTGLFLVLCINSFIQARRARQAAAPGFPVDPSSVDRSSSAP